MAKYIEREAALALVMPDDPTDEKAAVTIATAKKLVRKVLKDTPTADVVPVVHGKWLNFYGDYRTAECSVCANQHEVTFDGESNGALFDGFKQFYKYCPSCGARMDGGADDVDCTAETIC